MPPDEVALKIGDIVEIIDANNENHTLRGEIKELGPPLKIAFTYVETFKVKQVKKVDVPSLLTWNELRARAKQAGIPAAGKREDLEATLVEHIAAAEPLHSLTRGLASEDFEVGAIVQVNDPEDRLRHNCRGKVIDGPSVTVRLTNMDFEVEERRYAKSKLIRVG